MEIGILLEELINIAQLSKTDFAIGMNMTPSGLSKILTGRRLPLFKEKRLFCLIIMKKCRRWMASNRPISWRL